MMDSNKPTSGWLPDRDAQTASLEEPADPDREPVENPRKRQFRLAFEDLRGDVGPEHVCHPRFGVEDDHDQHAHFDVFRNLDQDIAPPIARRQDFEDDFRNFGTITVR